MPLTIERLERTDKAGKLTSLVLPGFAGGNERMLSALAKRSDIAVVTSLTQTL